MDIGDMTMEIILLIRNKLLLFAPPFNKEPVLMSILRYREKIRNKVGFSWDCFMFMAGAKISPTPINAGH